MKADGKGKGIGTGLGAANACGKQSGVSDTSYQRATSDARPRPSGAVWKQVKRNIERFPGDFMFQLTKEECSKSQIATLNEGRGHNIKKLPYAFTENGVAMLSSVLRSKTAIEVNK